MYANSSSWPWEKWLCPLFSICSSPPDRNVDTAANNLEPADQEVALVMQGRTGKKVSGGQTLRIATSTPGLEENELLCFQAKVILAPCKGRQTTMVMGTVHWLTLLGGNPCSPQKTHPTSKQLSDSPLPAVPIKWWVGPLGNKGPPLSVAFFLSPSFLTLRYFPYW